jgi:hypothetical protein
MALDATIKVAGLTVSVLTLPELCAPVEPLWQAAHDEWLLWAWMELG